MSDIERQWDQTDEAGSKRLKALEIGISWATEGAGGSGRIFADLTGHLGQFGVETFGAVAEPASASERTQGRIQSFAPTGAGMLPRLRGARRTIKRMLVERSPDLIASHFALYTAPILDELAKRPFVMHFHGPWAAESLQEGAHPLAATSKRLLERAVYRRADRVIVLSQAFADVAVKDYGVDTTTIRIIPGAVDLQRFAPVVSRDEARRTLNWPEDRFILVAVRRLVSRMGLDQLLEAMVPVCAAYPKTLLYVVGKGRLRQELEQRAAALKLGAHVVFLGFVPDKDLPMIYRAADLNVVPTLALEGFGLVAVEALAAATPSMVTPVGGLPETVAGLSQELVFASATSASLAEGLLRVCSGEIRLPTAEQCRGFAEEHFSVERMASAVAGVYREACGNR